MEINIKKRKMDIRIIYPSINMGNPGMRKFHTGFGSFSYFGCYCI
jgi:hypothetical protein